MKYQAELQRGGKTVWSKSSDRLLDLTMASNVVMAQERRNSGVCDAGTISRDCKTIYKLLNEHWVKP